MDKITIENARVTDKGVELKQSSTGKDFAQLTIMWSSSRKNRQTGEREYGETKFVTVRVFGFAAQDIAAGINPGDRVNVTGSIEHFVWQSQGGPKDDWSIFADSVTLPVPRAQGGGGFQQQAPQQAGFQQQGDPWGGAPQGGFSQQDTSNPPF